jgi:hypothetical protein
MFGEKWKGVVYLKPRKLFYVWATSLAFSKYSAEISLNRTAHSVYIN